MEDTGSMGYYAIRLIRPGAGRSDLPAAQEIASVKARDMSEAIAIALRRYPGYIAIHGERH